LKNLSEVNFLASTTGYIAAEMADSEVQWRNLNSEANVPWQGWKLTIGDDKTYGGYRNIPLSTSNTYKIYYGIKLTRAGVSAVLNMIFQK